MRYLLLLALVASGSAEADDVMWSIGQTSLSPEYVFCKAESDCMPRTVKVVDMDQRPAVASRIPVALPLKQVESAESMTVQFRLASSVLDEKARTEIGQLIKAAGPLQTFTIIGMTDKLGSGRFNRRLAKARARSVQRLLVKSGVPAARIVVSSTCCVDFPPIDNPPARKAVIRLSDPEKTR